MSSLCTDQHKFHPCHQLFLSKKSLRQIDIPPRKLLSRRSAAAMDSVGDMFMDSPRSEEALFQKYLPYNNPHDDDDDVDPYSADQFRMYEFKVRRCTRSRSHDWTDCPFAHPGEKARRRDPRRYHYSGTVCPEFRRGGCPRGDNCEFAHGVFECWLHPARYRTEACKDGKNCKRKVCFFAHTAKQLRILPSDNYPVSGGGERKYRTSTGGGQHCCAHCHCAVASPTSILMAMPDLSPPASPPVSPIHKSRQIGGFSPVSRFNDRLGNLEMNHHHHLGLSYKDTLIELMTSLESMGVSEHSPRTTGGGGGGINNLTWMDVSTCEDPQFIMSPSAPSPSKVVFGSGQFARRNKNISFVDENGAGGAPDLGWVNDLLT